MTTIRDAVDALSERKQSAVEGLEELGQAALVDTDVMKAMCIGLDVDTDELYSLSDTFAFAALGHILVGRRPSLVLSGAWIDGLLTGLMLADLRGRQDAANRCGDCGGTKSDHRPGCPQQHGSG